MNIRSRVGLLALFLSTTPTLGLCGETAGVKPDKRSQSWYVGIPVELDIWFPRAAATAGAKYLAVYLTAPIDAAVAWTPELWIETPQGRKLLPAHQDTLSGCAMDSAGVETTGYFVVAASKAGADEVRVGSLSSINDAVSGAPLASALKVGTAWVPLNSHLVIEYGLATGQLELRRFMDGGKVLARGISGKMPACNLPSQRGP